MKWWLRHRLLKPHLLWQDLWWGFLHRTFKRFNKVELRSLKPGYYDADHRILHASFQLLKDFVEKERPFERIDWERDEGHRNAASEIKALYHWWTVDYPARKTCAEQISDAERPKAFETWSKGPDEGLSFGPKEAALEKMVYPKYHAALELDRDLEVKWEREEEENLIRLAKIRRYLWT